MTDAEREELERLRQENAELRTKVQRGKNLELRVSQKGAVSVYGLNRFPVTLYKEQWERLLDFQEQIREFIRDHENELAVKGKAE
ncbi:MAG TPA: hypothetical protein PLD82_03655 [Spirochaetota bacterium]|nr:hypothetical protein [Spirochaetota bacterium]HPH03982.1 hypothetical protein [Spirochaetota bacterium]